MARYIARFMKEERTGMKLKFANARSRSKLKIRLVRRTQRRSSSVRPKTQGTGSFAQTAFMLPNRNSCPEHARHT
jgi:hypothetical protein